MNALLRIDFGVKAPAVIRSSDQEGINTEVATRTSVRPWISGRWEKTR